jgi:hypothetical protein
MKLKENTLSYRKKVRTDKNSSIKRHLLPGPITPFCDRYTQSRPVAVVVWVVVVSSCRDQSLWVVRSNPVGVLGGRALKQ